MFLNSSLHVFVARVVKPFETVDRDISDLLLDEPSSLFRRVIVLFLIGF